MWQYYRDDPNNNITRSESFKFKIKITGKTPAVGNTKDVWIAVSLKYLSNFWRTLEMPLVYCEINLILIWSEDCLISSATRATRFKITDTKLYIPVVTLSINRTINWNEYQPKLSPERQNQYLDFLIDTSFQGVNRLFVLWFENEEDRKVRTGYNISKVEIKGYDVMIDGKTFLISQLKVIWKHMIIFQKLQQVKEIITLLAVY